MTTPWRSQKGHMAVGILLSSLVAGPSLQFLATPSAKAQDSKSPDKEHSTLRHRTHPDSPLEAAQFRLLQESGGTMIVKREAFLAALKDLQSKKQLASHNIGRTIAGVPVRLGSKEELATAELEKAIWSPVGNNGLGGRTRSIVIDPKNPQNMWIGAVGGGIWRSEDGGQSFKQADDFMPTLAVSCMTIDPAGTVYAGTGESFDAGDGIKGAGIFRSADGRHWEQISSTSSDSRFEYVNRIAAAPQPSSGTLLVATSRGVFRSTDADLRADWTKTSLTTAIADVKFSPEGKLAVAGGFNSAGSVDSFYSTDDGIRWSPSTHSDPWYGRVELAFAATDSKIVYASVDNNSGEIWESQDGGASFHKKASKTISGVPAYFLGDSSGDPKYDQGTYANTIWAGDSDPKVLIVGGLDLWISKDGGVTLKPISTWWDQDSAHADQHAIVAVPKYETNRGSIFFANDGGLYEVQDVWQVGIETTPPYTKGWINHNNSYKVSQFYSGAVSSMTKTVIGGSQDNGTLRLDPQTSKWIQASKNGGGDGGISGADAAGTLYGEYAYLNIHRSVDDGRSFLYISGQYWNPCAKNPDNTLGAYQWKKVPYVIPDAESSDGALFIAPFVVDPSNDNRIYAGGRSLWLTDDARTKNVPDDIFDQCTSSLGKLSPSGPSWSRIKGPIGSKAEHRISALSLSSERQPTLWVAYVNGNIYKSTGGTVQRPTWSEPLNNSVVGWPHRDCLSIKVDPKNPSVVYATFGGYESDNVWKTTNGGRDWQSIGKSLPKAPVRSVTIHPLHSSYVYLGTEVGLFASEDGGLTWSPTNEGPTNASVEQLFWEGPTLFAATHGRGMWQINLPK